MHESTRGANLAAHPAACAAAAPTPHLNRRATERRMPTPFAAVRTKYMHMPRKWTCAYPCAHVCMDMHMHMCARCHVGVA